MTDWQDISTAPKDGTMILALTGDDIVVAYWVRHRAYKNCWAWMVRPWKGCDFLMTIDPTHWHPLPAPPTPKGGA